MNTQKKRKISTGQLVRRYPQKDDKNKEVEEGKKYILEKFQRSTDLEYIRSKALPPVNNKDHVTSPSIPISPREQDNVFFSNPLGRSKSSDSLPSLTSSHTDLLNGCVTSRMRRHHSVSSLEIINEGIYNAPDVKNGMHLKEPVQRSMSLPNSPLLHRKKLVVKIPVGKEDYAPGPQKSFSSPNSPTSPRRKFIFYTKNNSTYDVINRRSSTPLPGDLVRDILSSHGTVRRYSADPELLRGYVTKESPSNYVIPEDNFSNQSNEVVNNSVD